MEDFSKETETNGYLTFKWYGSREWLSSDTWTNTEEMR